MLHLQASVDFQEEKFVTRGVVQEFDGAGGTIAHGARQGEPRTGPCACVVSRQARRRSLLDNLLIAPLQRAVALAERDHTSRAITENLHLHVAGGRNEALQKTPPSAKWLPARRCDQRRLLRGREIDADTHADATAARRCLEHHRKANGTGRFPGRFEIADQDAEPGRRGTSARSRQLARAMLQTEVPHVVRRRSYEDISPLAAHSAANSGILAQKAIARVDCLGAASRAAAINRPASR